METFWWIPERYEKLLCIVLVIRDEIFEPSEGAFLFMLQVNTTQAIWNINLMNN